MDEPMNFKRTFSAAGRHWRLFLAVGAAVVLLSVIFSGPRFLKPRYRSQAVVYPVNISTYSIESTTDQLVQLMASNSIRDSVVHKFGLVKHYGLDTSSAEGRSILHYLWQERVSIEKTRFESVDLEVTDEDPVLARDMVLEVLHQTNLLARRIQRQNSGELLNVVNQDLARTRQKLDSIEKRMDQLRTQDGLLDYEIQTKEVTRGYLAAGGPRQNEIAGRLKALEDHGGEFFRLSTLNEQILEEYAKKLAQQRQVQLDLTKELTYSNLVVRPEVPDKKIFPVRWLVVLISTFAALLLCYVLVFLRDQRRAGAQRG